MKTFEENIGNIVMIVLMICMVIFLLNPALRTVKLIQNNITALQDSKVKAEGLLNQYDKITQSYNRITDEQKMALEKSLPVNVNNVRLILELQRIAHEHSMGFKDVDINLKEEATGTRSAANDNLRKVKINVTLVGSYPAYLKVLSDMEQSLRILTLRSVAFKTPVDPKKINQYQFDLGLETYWLTNNNSNNVEKESANKI